MFCCSQTDQSGCSHASCGQLFWICHIKGKKTCVNNSAVTCRCSNGHVLQHTLLFHDVMSTGQVDTWPLAECEARDCRQSAGDTLLNRRCWTPVGRVQSTTCTAQMVFEGNQLFHFEVPELPRLWFNIEHISSCTTTARKEKKTKAQDSSTLFSLTLTYILLTLYNLIQQLILTPKANITDHVTCPSYTYPHSATDALQQMKRNKCHR